MKSATTDAGTIPARLTSRVLDEGYGPGAWHGADFKAAIADVTPALAFRRPAAGRHNIAEIAIHHAFYVHSVRGRLLGTSIEPFVFEGEDWFAMNDASRMSWPEIQRVVATQQERLAEIANDIANGRMTSPLSESERFDLVLGITCHAVYHAGQVQLIKVML